MAIAPRNVIKHTSGPKKRESTVSPDGSPLLAVPLRFTCVKHPELRFLVGGEVITDEYHRQIAVRGGEFRRFANTQFLATTQAEADFCQSDPDIFEEPAEGQVWKSGDGFLTRNETAWDHYQTKNAS